MKASKRIKNWYWLQRDRFWGKRLAGREKQKGTFQGLSAFGFFLGYPRSGHSLVGSLLDAHPHTAIAHEQDALAYIHRGFSREELYALLLRNTRKKARKGRQETGYSYQVAGQYQGSWEELRLIGDKRGGNSSRWLKARPDLMRVLKDEIEEDLRVVHVSRNPFDNIATMALRHSKGKNEALSEALLRQEMEHYFSLAGAVESARQDLPEEAFHQLPYEALLADPEGSLTELLHFLGLEADPGYLGACKEVLFKTPHRSRWKVPWSDALLKEVSDRTQELPCLAFYDFEEGD